ncbi:MULTISPECIES: hypothetical protein [Phyllobacteriaceae]|uniref:Heme exporter protein D n=1 Tax=Phyllobacterium phragmitis TaxID=2670329 RepID=A0ABQ0GUK8_9HYPH|nr:hypothetical protein [Mesorhizobium sp. RMAD-H1]MBB2972373.1 hypothetical protein [Mesorhizobium sp. RMAD-H1]
MPENFLWFLIVAGGPVLLGALIAYGMMKTRRLRRDEREARDRATRKLYGDE